MKKLLTIAPAVILGLTAASTIVITNSQHNVKRPTKDSNEVHTINISHDEVKPLAPTGSPEAPTQNNSDICKKNSSTEQTKSTDSAKNTSTTKINCQTSTDNGDTSINIDNHVSQETTSNQGSAVNNSSSNIDVDLEN